MKTTGVSLLLAAGTAYASTIQPRASGVQGFDISSYQGTVNFAGAYGAGARFVMIKATEGTTYIDSTFSSHYDGATSAGLIRGAYHFAHPDSSSGATQAEYFLAHGGGWTNDGITLPGMLDIEYNPSGSTCYGLSASAMVSWIKDFGETYNSKTGRYPMIYSTADWWSTCTGDSTSFSSDYPLVLAQYASSISTVPGGWPYQSFWQNADSYSYGGDSDLWNGSEDSLKTFAKGS
uniref:Lysozyme n=1 Tax=Penicillium sp. TaxID=5081 RepID=A0A7S6K840_PENSQ|nr:GH25 muramidase [Penicillium sp.]